MMKRLLFALLMIAVTLGAVSFRHAVTDKKKALIIAIGHYKKGTGWDTLGSLRDEQIIRDALTKQGFGAITSLLDEKADLEGIRAAMKTFIATVNPGDVVYIHFSGHGQQVADNNGERDEMDRLDECLVPWDAPMTAANGYKGDKHLRDDEFGQWMQLLRSKAGPKGDVLVVLDACHSGTALRGENRSVTRGNAKPLIPDGFDKTQFKPSQEPGSVDNMTADVKGVAPIVSISACRAHEVNSEYNDYGSLSVAVTRTFEKIRPGDSYNTFFAHVAAEMAILAQGQNPVLEGQPNHAIFGTQTVEQAAYYSVRTITSTMVWIEGGKLSGLYKGSKIALMPAGSSGYDPARAVFTGEIASADNHRAMVKVDKDLTKYNGKQLWLFVTAQSFGANKLIIGSGEGLDGNVKRALKETVSKLPFAEWNENDPEVRIEYKNDRYDLVLADGNHPAEPMETPQAVNIALQDYMQGRLLKQVSFSDPDLDVELQLLPVVVMDGSIVEIMGQDDKKVNGISEFGDEDMTLIKLKNNGAKDAYINILEIGPTGKVRVVLPDYKNNASAVDFKLPKGDSIIVKTFAYQATKPYGKYVLKLFATDVPVSFKHIFNTRGDDTRGPGFEHPSAQIFRYSFIGTTRSENLQLSASGGGSTSEYTYILKKP